MRRARGVATCPGSPVRGGRGWMGRALRQVADKSAQGRIAMVLEAVYDLVALESGLLSATHGVVDSRASEPLEPGVGHDGASPPAEVPAGSWRP